MARRRKPVEPDNDRAQTLAEIEKLEARLERSEAWDDYNREVGNSAHESTGPHIRKRLDFLKGLVV